MEPFGHVILTRFNVRQSPDDTRLARDEAWLTRRLELFDAFCYPSVRAQTVENFQWLVFFDQATPEAFRDRIAAYGRWSRFRAAYVDGIDPARLGARVLACLGERPSHLITTRLDNDDALARDFIETVQAAFRGQAREVINVTSGYIWRRGRVYLHRDRSNAFASLVERAPGAQTVWCRQHHRLAEVAPIRQVGASPGWMQVVHGGNVRNRVRGVRQPGEVLEGRFRINPPMPPPGESTLALQLDRRLLSPLRLGREAAIEGLRWVLGRRRCRPEGRPPVPASRPV